MRGRPREYDSAVATQRILDVFWRKGYSATSLDDLARASRMSRPSLYAAFGDKRQMYLRSIAAYREFAIADLQKTLGPNTPIRRALYGFFRGTIDYYLPSDDQPGIGCFIVGTAMAEGVTDAAIRAAFSEFLEAIDTVLNERFVRAIERGEFAPRQDPLTLARMTSSILHSLAVRSRAGDSRSDLDRLARHGLDMICGGPALRKGNPRVGAGRPRASDPRAYREGAVRVRSQSGPGRSSPHPPRIST